MNNKQALTVHFKGESSNAVENILKQPIIIVSVETSVMTLSISGLIFSEKLKSNQL